MSKRFNSAVLILVLGGISIMACERANAGLDERVAADFAAKYTVCATKLRIASMPLRALKLERETREVTRDHIGDGFLVYKEDRKQRYRHKMTISKCRRLADRL